MSQCESGTTDIELHRSGGVDEWLMPLSLIGVVVVLGPLLALGFENMPREWLHEHTMALTVALTVACGVVLVVSYLGAKKLVNARHRLLRISGDTIGVYNRKGTRALGEAPRAEVDTELRHWTIRSPAGNYASPVLWMKSPGSDWLTMTVDDPQLRWSGEVQECEEEADYQVPRQQWERLLEALGLENRLMSV